MKASDEFISMIKTAIDEEISDREKYLSMADMAYEEGLNKHIAGILKDIANDECSHHSALLHIKEMICDG